MRSSETVSGTHDGCVLARKVEDCYREGNTSVTLDFGQIISISNSASCAFWGQLFQKYGEQVIKKISFTELAPRVLRNLEYGLEFANKHTEVPPEVTPA